MNTPNVLILLRVAMIPLFVAAFLTAGISDWVTLALFALAAITDALDGYIARKKNIVTDFGKLMVMAAFICFTYAGLLHPAVTIVVMSREFLVTGIRTLATSKGKVIAADFLGKLKTVFQDITIILILVQSATGSPDASIIGVTTYLCIWIMAVLAIISAVNYCLKNKDIFKEKE